MNFLQESEISQYDWKEFFNSNTFASPFQSPEFYYLFNNIRGNSAYVFAVEEGKKFLALAVITMQKEKGITAYFSRRAILYGGPLAEVSKRGKEALSFLLNRIKKSLEGKAIYCEIRNSFDYSHFKNVFSKENWAYEPHLNVQINLKDKSPDEILSQMTYARRREIRLTINSGTLVRKATNDQEVMAFYKILHDLYKKKVKLPLPEFNYFRTLFNDPPGITFVVIHQGLITGGAFCLYAPYGTIYTIYYAGIRDNKIFHTTYAIWGAIEFGINHGLTTIDLMGAGKPGVPYGVRDFKMEFRGDLVEHGRFRKIFNPVMYKIGKAGIKTLQKFG